MLHRLKRLHNSPYRLNLFGLILINALTLAAALAVFLFPIVLESASLWLVVPSVAMTALLAATGIAVYNGLNRKDRPSDTTVGSNSSRAEDRFYPAVQHAAESARRLRVVQDRLTERLIRKHAIDRQTFDILAQMNICSSRMTHQLLQCEDMQNTEASEPPQRTGVFLGDPPRWSVDQM